MVLFGNSESYPEAYPNAWHIEGAQEMKVHCVLGRDDLREVENMGGT